MVEQRREATRIETTAANYAKHVYVHWGPIIVGVLLVPAGVLLVIFRRRIGNAARPPDPRRWNPQIVAAFGLLFALFGVWLVLDATANL